MRLKGEERHSLPAGLQHLYKHTPLHLKAKAASQQRKQKFTKPCLAAKNRKPGYSIAMEQPNNISHGVPSID